MSTVTEIQDGLLNAGFSPGPIDGTAGPKTLAAVMAAITSGATATRQLRESRAEHKATGAALVAANQDRAGVRQDLADVKAQLSEAISTIQDLVTVNEDLNEDLIEAQALIEDLGPSGAGREVIEALRTIARVIAPS